MLLKSAKSSFHYSKQPRRGACSVVQVWQFWGKRRHGSNAAVGTIEAGGYKALLLRAARVMPPGSSDVQKSASVSTMALLWTRASGELRLRLRSMPSSCKGLI